jgi:carbon-monoxide dehydrogenase medium subunit
MKPAPFTLHVPTTLDEALDALADTGQDAKVLAGGQSLIPLLNMRLASPRHLVDVNGVGGLDRIDAGPSGVRVGALARHAEVEHHRGAADVVPLLAQALRLVAHPVIRNRGTTVGSLAHADPSGEMTAVLALLGGEMELARKGATRTVPAADFFLGPLESCLEPGELAVSAWFPALPARTGTAFCEVARRHGDYAMCGVAAAVTLDGEGRVARARTSYISMSATPVVLELTDAVVGQLPDTADWGAAAQLSADGLDPEPDIHATAEYRRHLGIVLTRQALGEAALAAASAGRSVPSLEPTP